VLEYVDDAALLPVVLGRPGLVEQILHPHGGVDAGRVDGRVPRNRRTSVNVIAGSFANRVAAV
jgi:hypothetical protein